MICKFKSSQMSKFSNHTLFPRNLHLNHDKKRLNTGACYSCKDRRGIYVRECLYPLVHKSGVPEGLSETDGGPPPSSLPHQMKTPCHLAEYIPVDSSFMHNHSFLHNISSCKIISTQICNSCKFIHFSFADQKYVLCKQTFMIM